MRKLFSGCLMAIGAVVVLMVIGRLLLSHSSSGDGVGTSAPREDQTEQPAFSITRANTTYNGTVASDVGVAILRVGDAGPYLSNGYEMERADGKFITVEVAVANRQNTAITMNTSLFEILDSNGNTYSASEKSLTLLGASDDLFLAQINPGVTKTGVILFDVPQALSLDGLQLKFRGGMTGSSALLPLKVNSVTQPVDETPVSVPQPSAAPAPQSPESAPETTKADSLAIGQTPAQVEAILGPPLSITTGAKHVYNYANFSVEFDDGKVSKIDQNSQASQ